jgi:hypothetical protein
MKQLLRRLVLALSLAGVLVGGQLAFVAAPAQARPGWPPIVADGGICEDGTGGNGPVRCPVLVRFDMVLMEDLRFFLTTLPGSAMPDKDYIPLEREPVSAQPGTVEMEVEVWIIPSRRCEPPRNFTLLLSTDEPADPIVAVELEIREARC